MQLRSPKPLIEGDTIGIVSTARKITEEELLPAKGYLEENGFRVKLGESIGAEYNQFAGDDSLRTKDLQSMLNDSSVKAILCARGGYGTVRIIDKLDFRKYMESPKWIAGYSDVTALHMLVNIKLGIQSLHSPMALGFEKLTNEARDSFLNALKGNPLKYSFPGDPKNREGSCESMVIGGNLSVLYSLSGTNNGGVPARSILFMEDLDEYLYHIDRMAMNFKRGGKLSRLAGLMVGGMTDMNDNTIPFGKTANEIVREHIKDESYPVCFGFPAGHIPDNRVIILGRKAKLEIGKISVDFLQKGS